MDFNVDGSPSIEYRLQAGRGIQRSRLAGPPGSGLGVRMCRCGVLWTGIDFPFCRFRLALSLSIAFLVSSVFLVSVVF